MKKIILLLILIPALAFGKCNGSPDDKWNGSDKFGHVMLGGIPAIIVGTQFESPSAGFWTGTVISLGKELIDMKSRNGVCSAKDFLAGVLGAGIGAGGAYYIINFSEDRVYVGFITKF